MTIGFQSPGGHLNDDQPLRRGTDSLMRQINVRTLVNGEPGAQEVALQDLLSVLPPEQIEAQLERLHTIDPRNFAKQRVSTAIEMVRTEWNKQLRQRNPR